MDEATTMTSVQEALSFPFRSPDWRDRFLVGSVITIASFLIPVIPLIFVFGYALTVMRQAIEGQALTLPQWDDWGKLAMDGLRVLATGLAYLLPALVVTGVGFAFYFAATFATPFALEAGDEAVWPLLFFGSFIVMFLSLFVGTVLTVLGMIPLPMAIAQLADEDELSAAFRFGDWWRVLRTNPLGVLVAWVVVAGLVSILYLATMLAYYTLVLCCAIPILMGPIGFYLAVVSAALFGRTYRDSVALMVEETEQSVPADG